MSFDVTHRFLPLFQYSFTSIEGVLPPPNVAISSNLHHTHPSGSKYG